MPAGKSFNDTEFQRENTAIGLTIKGEYVAALRLWRPLADQGNVE
jgi:hypothetical protein